jgi:flagellar biosynthesis protein FliR
MYPFFMLVVARTLALTLQTPYLGSATVPGMVRVSICLSLSFFYLLGTPNLPAEIPTSFFALYAADDSGVFWWVFCLASAPILFWWPYKQGGEIIDVQIGLSMVMQFNPQNQTTEHSHRENSCTNWARLF